MKRRELLLNTIAGISGVPALLTCCKGSQAVQPMRFAPAGVPLELDSHAFARADFVLNQVRGIIDKVHAEASFDPWICRLVSENEINSIPSVDKHGHISGYTIDIVIRDCSLIEYAFESSEIAGQYKQMVERHVWNAVEYCLSRSNVPETSKHELELWLGDNSKYRLYETYSYQHAERRDQECSYFCLKEHLPAMCVHPPSLTWLKVNQQRYLNVGLHSTMETGPYVRQYVRKHTGVHKIYGYKVQWKEGHPLPGEADQYRPYVM